LSDDAIICFILNNKTYALMGILIALDVYIFRNLYNKVDKLTFSSSILGITTSTCGSCSSIGFFKIPTFEVFGLVVADFFTKYHVPLRIFSIIIILWPLIAVFNKITKVCDLSKKFLKTSYLIYILL
jgi:phosphate starvation-inducible membrane PsiE